MILAIEHDAASLMVRLWLYEEGPEGRTYTWPEGWCNVDTMTWNRKSIPQGQAANDVRPLLEIPNGLWQFLQREIVKDAGPSTDAVPILQRALAVEQARVDKLLNVLMTPVMVSTKEK